MKSAIVWVFRPAPIEGEIFSSYLARIARAHGLSPYRFYSFHFPGLSVWNRDIDRSASDLFIAEVATHCDTSIATISAMTLRGFESSFHSPVLSAHQSTKGVAPWINAAGVYHRDRKGFAMQYCPHCLAAEPAYKTIWRFSFVTVCERHHCPLLDCCTHCGAQIVFHRNEAFHVNCHRCGRSLLHTSESSSTEDEWRIRFHVQTILLSAAQQGETPLLGETMTSTELFVGLAILMRTIKSKLRAKRLDKHLLPPVYAKCLTQRIELLRVQERAQQCLMIADLLNNWPNQFLAFAISQQLTQMSFKEEANYPAWLRHIVTVLPAGMPRSRSVTVAPIRKKLRSIHRHKNENWRTERAKLLLKKARVQV